ncbi:DNA primase [SAR202 cluster bacterium AD-802-E10_MRT_200m]|nr:DNA primase [SAR202 cluster bacterium AD-802-E10_MRT_200m]
MSNWSIVTMALVDDIKQQVDLVTLVSEYVSLVNVGQNFRARCPFHSERTPSFYVFPERQTWRCFGACATGGDAFSFVMKADNLEFSQVLDQLASRVGITRPSKQTQDTGFTLYKVNESASLFYTDHLISSIEGKDVIKYLTNRGISEQSIDSFSLGLAPTDWGALKSHLSKLGYPEELMEKAGLISRTKEGNTRDFFHNRLLFPIRNIERQITGFGARSLDSTGPKYLNTPNTQIFNKRALLYGIDQAANSIRDQNVGVIVEGYTDVILAHQHGFANVVASMGTALTEQQVAQLVNIASSFVLAMDPDTAGQEATLRSLEVSWKIFHPPFAQGNGKRSHLRYRQRPRTQLRVAVLPKAQDPADLIRENPEHWVEAIRDASGLMEFLFQILPPKYDLTTPQGKLQIAERIGTLLLGLQNSDEQDGYLERLENLLGVNRRTLDEMLGLSRQAILNRPAEITKANNPVQGYLAPFRHSTQDPLEDYTLALLLQNRSLSEFCERLKPDFFQRSENMTLFTHQKTCATIEELKAHLDTSLHEHLDRLVTWTLPPLDHQQREDALKQCIRRLEERNLREHKSQEGMIVDAYGNHSHENSPNLDDAVENNRKLRKLFIEKSNRSMKKSLE